MIPSLFIILDKLPLNANGKIDRKSLPHPESEIFSEKDYDNSMPLSPLERHLQTIFCQSLNVASVPVDRELKYLGGSSLDAMRILSAVRQEICDKIDINLVLINSSVKELARAMEPLMVMKKTVESDVILEAKPIDTIYKPSFVLEAVGIGVLMCLWVFPILSALYSRSMRYVILVPILHMLPYAILRYFWFSQKTETVECGPLYSWRYYQWWFLDRLWSVNNSYWLQHLVGTPFYNTYLRLCGARIGNHAHIYSTNIDAPWLLQIGDSTVISTDTLLTSLSLDDETYSLQEISIGSYCSIDSRCVLYGGVKMESYIHVKPMSAITGDILQPTYHTISDKRYISKEQTMYQLICILCILGAHITLIFSTFLAYEKCRVFSLPLFISLVLAWLYWTLLSLVVVLFSLKVLVRHTVPGIYSINSYYYLRKIWLRQLLISSFRQSFELFYAFDELSPIALRWLNAHVADNVKLGNLHQLLYFPSNLQIFEHGVTTFGGVMLSPFALTPSGHCYIDEIYLGSGTNLGNQCTLMPGAKLPHNCMVGTLTLITKDIDCSKSDTVLLGIPGRSMPFAMSNTRDSTKEPSVFESSFLNAIWCACLFFFITKASVLFFYCVFPGFLALLAHTVFLCVIYRYTTANQRTTRALEYSEFVTYTGRLAETVKTDFVTFIGPFLARTQFLVLLLRGLGADIGRDVLLSDIGCLLDPQLTTIGDHVRFHTGSTIQCHTFEQRVFKIASVNVQHSSVLMSNSIVHPGSILKGRNRLLPLTLVMKSDQLPYATVWSGVPAQRIQ
ncbi:unnamed protein product [Adineta ricciae]|nr:unnamed protein product [Adineta ricciae]